MPLAELTVKRGREQELKVALREIRTAIDAYKKAAGQGHIELDAEATGYPPTLEVLVTGVEDAASLDKRMIYFLRRLPRDPQFPDGSVPAAETWGVRSYASSPTEPQAGDDVYDVYSLATGQALDGSSYREW